MNTIVDGNQSVVLEPLRGMTVLVVDDESIIVELVTRLLEKNGARVHPAGTAQEAVRVFDLHRAEIDFILLDYFMPGGGDAVVQRVREVAPRTRIVLATGYRDDEPGVRGLLSQRGVGFLAKPFTEAELLKALGK